MKIEREVKARLILYRFECYGNREGEKANYIFEFYEEDLFQAWDHANSLLERYAIVQIEGWRINHLGFIDFN